MIDSSQINKLVQRLLDALPPGLSTLPEDIKKNLRQTLHNTLSKMELVTREEFDIQTKVLARTREKLERLEKTLQELEQSKK